MRIRNKSKSNFHAAQSTYMEMDKKWIWFGMVCSQKTWIASFEIYINIVIQESLDLYGTIV